MTGGTEVEDSLANSRVGLFIDGTERGRYDLLSLDIGDGHAQKAALSSQGRCARTSLGIRRGLDAGSKRETEGIKFGDRTLSGSEALGRTYTEDL